MSYKIDTRILLDALQHYECLGYSPISVPLLIDKDVSGYTRPEFRKDFFHSNGQAYVASAEQSFYQLMKTGDLSNGKYMAITPCYRDEGVLDETHLNIFLKIELFFVGGDKTVEFLSDAHQFFSKYAPTDIVETCQGFDLEIGGIEVGSYGTRMYQGNIVTYGTGIAEPRFSFAISKLSHS